MRRYLRITPEPIDASALETQRTPSSSAGAVIVFLGIVRGEEKGSPIAGLNYEAFESMASHQFGLIFDHVERQWPVESVRLIHRIGTVGAGEPSLWLEVSAPHRGEAYAASQWIIEEMKRTVPIWKHPLKENGGR